MLSKQVGMQRPCIDKYYDQEDATQFKDSLPLPVPGVEQSLDDTGLSLNTAHLLTLTSSHLQCVWKV